MTYAVFKLEVREFTYLGKHFPCVNANWCFGKCRKDKRNLTKVKVVITLWSGMVTVGNQGQDDRYIRLWRCNMSQPAVSRSCDCHVFGQAFLSWQITEKSENDWIDLRAANNPSSKEGIVFSFSVLFTAFSRQTSILRLVIMVVVFSHQGGCCIFTISTFLRIQPRVLCVWSTAGFCPAILWNEISAYAHDGTSICSC